jgi:hypothetical protein
MNVDGSLMATPVASVSAEDASHDVSAPINEGIDVISDTDDIQILRCIFNIPWPIMQANLMNLLQSVVLWTLHAPHGTQAETSMLVNSLGIIESPAKWLNNGWMGFGLLYILICWGH